MTKLTKDGTFPYKTKDGNFPYLGYGVGLRPPHYSYIFENKPPIDWFEIISENYMDTDGRPKRMLEKVLADYPVIMHGVSLSIGTVDPLKSEYLRKLKDLMAWVQPAWVSDHLCWTGVAHKNTHDLLPVPYTEEALTHIIDRIKQVQDILGRQLVLENPSTYLEFSSSSMPEWEFIARMAEGADCGLLLDANNVYVSCYNHKWDPKTYIDALPLDRVAQIHLAGHTNKGTHIVDTHDDHVIDEVWNVYSYIMQRAGRDISTMVEWDGNIPDFPVVLAEVEKARVWREKATELPTFNVHRRNDAAQGPAYAAQLDTMQAAILDGDAAAHKPEDWIVSKPDFPASDQLKVYISGYRFRLFDTVYEDYPALRHYMGKDAFNKLLDAYVEGTPSEHPNISRYIEKFPAHVRDHADPFAHELAVMETHISRLFDAKETVALTPEALADITPEKLMGTKLKGRAALALCAFAWPVNDYVSAVLADETPEKPKETASFVAVYRHNDTMWRLPLEEREHLLLSSLFSGMTVGEAMEAALPGNDDDAADVQRWFSKWMSNGVLAA
ncbi:MAG: DUF692 family protein [Alphaproteobacteria bacterium]|nr:DUF692 family protein [Alphaproteobacteria bacterium]